MLIHNFFLIFMTYVLTIKVFNFSLLSLPELQVFDAGSLKALRAARVLRPLKLVSGIPSKSTKYVYILFYSQACITLSFPKSMMESWNAVLQPWTKSVGTVAQFERFWTQAKLYPRTTNTARPYPLPTDLSTLYWVGKGEGRRICKMTALLFTTLLVTHIELQLCSDCPKDFCPGM